MNKEIPTSEVPTAVAEQEPPVEETKAPPMTEEQFKKSMEGLEKAEKTDLQQTTSELETSTVFTSRVLYQVQQIEDAIQDLSQILNKTILERAKHLTLSKRSKKKVREFAKALDEKETEFDKQMEEIRKTPYIEKLLKDNPQLAEALSNLELQIQEQRNYARSFFEEEYTEDLPKSGIHEHPIKFHHNKREAKASIREREKAIQEHREKSKQIITNEFANAIKPGMIEKMETILNAKLLDDLKEELDKIRGLIDQDKIKLALKKTITLLGRLLRQEERAEKENNVEESTKIKSQRQALYEIQDALRKMLHLI